MVQLGGTQTGRTGFVLVCFFWFPAPGWGVNHGSAASRGVRDEWRRTRPLKAKAARRRPGSTQPPRCRPAGTDAHKAQVQWFVRSRLCISICARGRKRGALLLEGSSSFSWVFVRSACWDETRRMVGKMDFSPPSREFLRSPRPVPWLSMQIFKWGYGNSQHVLWIWHVKQVQEGLSLTPHAFVCTTCNVATSRIRHEYGIKPHRQHTGNRVEGRWGETSTPKATQGSDCGYGLCVCEPSSFLCF